MTKQLEALIADIRGIAAHATEGKWWMDSHGEALVCFSELGGMKTILRPEHLRDKAHRDEHTGGLSYWPNDSDASWIVAAQPQNVLALIAALEQSKGDFKRLDERNATLNSTLDRWAVERAENANVIAELEAENLTTSNALLDAGKRIAELEGRNAEMLKALESHETFWSMREFELGSLSPEAAMVRDVGIRAIRAAGITVQGDE